MIGDSRDTTKRMHVDYEKKRHIEAPLEIAYSAAANDGGYGYSYGGGVTNSKFLIEAF